MKRFLLISDIHASDIDPASSKAPSYVSSYKPPSGLNLDPIAELEKLIREENLAPDCVLCAGDVTNKSFPAPFSYAWEKLDNLAKSCDAKLIATVGNHDVDSRYKSNAYDPRGFAMSLAPKIPVADRTHFLEFWAENFTLISNEECNVLALNTAAYHGAGRDAAAEIEHGRISDVTLAAISEVIKGLPTKPVNILLCHHHLIRPEPNDDDLRGQTRGGEKLVQLLSDVDGAWIAVHGHKHIRGATEDRYFEIAGHLPGEAAEALLEYAATGMLPTMARVVAVSASLSGSLPSSSRSEPPPEWAQFSLSEESPDLEKDLVSRLESILGATSSAVDAFAHPDSLRRFRTIESREDLEQALAAPWETWSVFLHPSQRRIIEREFSGPARVAGSAGTGKTVVALHRVARLAQGEPESRVLLTTFSRPLATMLQRKLEVLIGKESSVIPRVTVTPFRGVAEELYQLAFGRRPHAPSDKLVSDALAKAAADLGVTEFTARFLVSEWTNVIDAWQLDSADAYADVPRLGRKNRIGAKQRARLWPVFAAARKAINDRGFRTWAQIFAEVTAYYAGRERKPFTHIVVDEAQDLGVPELRLLAAIAPPGPDALFFAGDLGQRIFQQPFSWAGLGIDVRGRSQTLKVNYRTSHQIRRAADRLLPKVVRDVDGLEEERFGTVSVFNGPDPIVAIEADAEAEIARVQQWISGAVAEGIKPSEIGLFVRTRNQLDRARTAVRGSGHEVFELSERGDDPVDQVSIGTMHLAKGLEFKAVAVMACDDEVIPLQARIESVADEVDLDDVYETERQLLYVACTRARDRLLVSGVQPGSEFLSDLK